MFIRNVFLQVVLITTCLLNNALSVNRPNIIIVLADDLGWNDVSFHGSNQIPTPNIDALAYNGIILNSHYVPALCTPSRASLLTGKYPTSMGMQHLVILAPEPWGLPLEETLMPQHLKRHGYATHAIGKWHLGFHQKEYTPIYRGFDSHFGYWNGFQDYYDHTMQSESLKGYDMRRGLLVDESSKGKYSTDAFTDEAVSVIENHNSTQGPLFLYLSHLAPHAGNPDNPFQAPEEEIAKHSHISDPERRIYAAMVTKLDESIGRVVSALKNADMLDNSIILFMSDNGAVTFGMHSNRGSNYPLRGLKESPWEGGVRGVAVVWSPLLNQTRRVSNQMMHVSDWLPTLYTAAGLNTSELNGIDGMDMWNTLSYNLESPRTEVFNNYDEVENYSSLRMGSWKYIAGTAQGGEVDQWYGESGKDGNVDYDIMKVFESDTNIALSEYLEEKQLKSEDFVQKPISKDTILNLRRQSVVTCSYPIFSEFSLITNNHTEAVEMNITGEITNQRFSISEVKDKIIGELEDYYREHPGSVIRSNGYGFTPLERIHLENLIESGELVNVFKCDPLKMVCLFNLEKDPCERVNLAKIFPEIVSEMEIRLNQLKEAVVPPLNQPDDPFSDPSFHNGTWSNWCDVRREKDSQILIKLLTESVSSALLLDHFLVALFENAYFKTVATPLFSIFHDASHYLVQLTEWFYLFVTLLICAVVVLYVVAALRRVVSPQDDPKRKISWTRWENLTFRSITNPTAETEEDKSAFTKVR